jgi:TetR/AcrR family transcriptional repressor of nem operon
MRLTLRDGAEKIVSRVTTGIEQGEVEKCLPA